MKEKTTVSQVNQVNQKSTSTNLEAVKAKI